MKLVQFEPLFIRDFSTSVWPFPLHNHNHYELMFVTKGSGTHELNKITTEYSGTAVFFLSPDDLHDFHIVEETRFSVIKFLPTVLKGGINSSATDYWDNLLSNLSRKWDPTDRFTGDTKFLNKINILVDLMISEWQDNDLQVTEIHTNLLRSLLFILDKKMKDVNGTSFAQYGVTQIDRIQNYIHSHIHFPEKLTAKHLSKVFRLSESGLRSVFRLRMGMSLGIYISSLKIEMIKNRIKQSDSSLSQIALEFGFTDQSHFSKFFQKHTHMKPLCYKRENIRAITNLKL